MCAAVVLYTGSLVFAQEPARSDGWVVIPVDDYRSLRLEAYPPERPLEAPPVDSALTRIEYDLRVNGESVSGEARLTVDVLSVRQAAGAGRGDEGHLPVQDSVTGGRRSAVGRRELRTQGTRTRFRAAERRTSNADFRDLLSARAAFTFDVTLHL
jgi:hypothetical protein